jgi:hypothetical protein
MLFDKLDNNKLDVKPTSLSECLAQNPPDLILESKLEDFLR